MGQFPTSTAFLAICWALPLWVPCTTIFTVLYQLLLIYSVPFWLLWPWFLPTLLIKLSSFTSLILSNTAFWTLCASTLWAHIISAHCLPHLYLSGLLAPLLCQLWWFHHLGHLWFFHPFVIFLIFTVCGFNSQSSHPFLSRFLTFSFQLTILLGKYVFTVIQFEFFTQCGNSPSPDLHAIFSEFVNVCINCNPSVHSQFFIIGTFSSSVNLYVLALSIFITSTS